MSRGRSRSAARGFERLFHGGGTLTGLGESGLLERFVAHRDQAAFESLLARHGPMVLGVCSRLLDDPHEVEDAFQAVFLVLVRRAGSLRDGDRLGPWLYGVALKVAHRVRSRSARRRAVEKGGDLVAAVEPVGGGPPDLLGTELYEELERLPSKYRDPVVMCDLEGRTHEEAARLLRWPVGTVKGRLSRARELLRGRLVRRGLAPSVAAIVLSLNHDARASVPPALFEQTVRAAMGLAAGAGAATLAGSVSASVLGLADGVIATMLTGKLKATGLVLLGAGILTAGSAGFAYQLSLPGPATSARASESAVEPPRQDAPGVSAQPPADEVEAARRALETAQLGILRENYQQAVENVGSGNGLDQPRRISIEILQAALRLANDEPSALDAVRDHAKRMIELRQRYSPPNLTGTIQGVSAAGLEVLEAEARLWVAEQRAGRRLSGIEGRGFVLNPSAPRPDDLAGVMAGGPEKPARVDGPLVETPSGRTNSPARGAQGSQAEDPQNLVIIEALDRRVTVDFAESIPLGEFLKFIQASTQSEDLPNGLPIYFDPTPVDPENPTTLDSPVMMLKLEGIRLRTSLRLALKQLRLGYLVKDGLIYIGALDSPTFKNEADESVPGGGAVPGYGEMPGEAPAGPAGLRTGATADVEF